MFLLTVLLFVGATVTLGDKPYYDLNDADSLFEEFLQKHGKVYDPEEHLIRLDIFKENLKQINEHNARNPYTDFGVNRFTDLTAEERRHFLGFKPIDDSIAGLARKVEYPAEAITAPDQFDWRDHDVVTPVKDQGHCRASWIFSATGNMEGQHAIKHKKSISLSVQQSLDCVTVNNPSNCFEMWPHDVFDGYIYDYGVKPGVASEEEYPYTGRPVECRLCNEKHMPTITNITGYEIRSFNDEESLKQFLYETGPLAVGLDSSKLFEYTNGVLFPHSGWCQHAIDLAVLLVGYGVDKDGVNYWTLKNSWGKDWGENGYFRLVRGLQACHVGTRYTATCTVT